MCVSFEVYNEADLHWMFTDYYPMYKAAAAAVKSVDSKLQIGGPASAFSHYVQHLVDYTKADGTPLDFVSTHAYPTTGTKTFCFNTCLPNYWYQNILDFFLLQISTFMI